MNISLNEIMPIRKSIKFAANNNPAPTTETTATKPEGAMSALEAQAKNNIAFQGVTIPASAKSKMKALALTALMAAPVLTSCDKCNEDLVIKFPDTTDSTVININLDMSAITALVNKLLEQQEIDKAQHAEMMEALVQINNGIATNNTQDAEFYANVESLIAFGNAQLIANGKTAEEANAIMAEIRDLFDKGKYSEAMNKYTEILTSIDGKLDTIIAKFDELISTVNTNHTELMTVEKEQIDILNNLYFQGKIDQSYYEDIFKNSNIMVENQNIMKEDLAELKAGVDSLVAKANDTTQFNEIKTMIEGNHDGLMKFLKFAHIDDQMLMYQIKNDIKGAQKTFINGLKNFQNTYIVTESKELDYLAHIAKGIQGLEGFNGLDQTAIENAIGKVVEAVNNTKEDITVELQGVKESINAVGDKIDELTNSVKTGFQNFNIYAEVQAENWNDALGKLDEVNANLKDLKGSNNNIENIIKNIDKNVADLENEANKANVSLNSLKVQADTIIARMSNLEASSGKSLTRQEMEELLMNQNEDAYKKYVSFMQESGLANVSGDLGTVKDLLFAIKNLIANKETYGAQLSEMTEILKAINWNTAKANGQLDTIIVNTEEFICNCECGTNAGNNEGILDDLKNQVKN